MTPELIARLARVARSLEAGEVYYNAAKLAWALAFSGAVHLTNHSGLLEGEELLDEMKSVLTQIRDDSNDDSVTEAWAVSIDTISRKGYLSLAEVPEIQVCRRCGAIQLGVPPTWCPTCGAHRLTFRDFPVPWWPEPLSPAEALEALRSGPDEIAGALDQMPDELMALKPTETEWSVREVLAHLVFSNAILTERIRLMVTQDNPALENMLVGQQAGDAEVSGSDMFRRYADARSQTMRLLESLPLGGWYRVGHHTGIGTKTVLHQASYFAKHERLHVPHIAKIRTALGVPSSRALG